MLFKRSIGRRSFREPTKKEEIHTHPTSMCFSEDYNTIRVAGYVEDRMRQKDFVNSYKIQHSK